MPSRRDQVQSYQFFIQRMTSALVVHDADPTAAPFRRLGGAGLLGIMVAVICLAAFGVYGLVVPGGATGWRDGASVILEKETGTRYLYRDGRLHPVLNYASALLAMETAAPTVSVSRNSLVGTPRGPRIGIPDAPDSLPAPKRMLGGPWTLCSQQARNEAGEFVPTTVLTVGRRPAGGREMRDAALLARDAKNGRLYLIWHDHRYEITDERIVLEGLTLGSAPVFGAGGAWLNALPAGEPIGTQRVTGRGRRSQAVPDARIGQIYVVRSQGGDRQYYLVERDRLVPLSQLQVNVLFADPATREAYPNAGRPKALPLEADTAAVAAKAPAPADGRYRAPQQVPKIAQLAGDQPAVCAAYEPGRDEPKVMLDAQVQPVKEPVRTGEQTGDGIPLADRVVVEPGFGVLVSSRPTPDAPTGTLNLVTDLGYRYPLASEGVPAMLGYQTSDAVELPASLVVRLPAGPALDPATAKRAVDPE